MNFIYDAELFISNLFSSQFINEKKNFLIEIINFIFYIVFFVFPTESKCKSNIFLSYSLSKILSLKYTKLLFNLFSNLK